MLKLLAMFFITIGAAKLVMVVVAKWRDGHA